MIQVMRDLIVAGEDTAGAYPAATADIVRTVHRVEELLREGDVRAGREMAREALDAVGQHGDLLRVLAEAEFAAGDSLAGWNCLTEALATLPQECASMARHIKALRSYWFWHEALALVEALPADVLGDPLVRAEAGRLYSECGCPAHAADAYGPRRGLPCTARAARRWCQMRSGGPITPLCLKSRAREEAALQTLRRTPSYISSIASVGGLDAQHTELLRAQLTTLNYRYKQLSHRFWTLFLTGYRMVPLAVFPVWLVLLAVVTQAGFQHDFTNAAEFSAVSAVVATASVVSVTWGLITPGGRVRFPFLLRLSTRTVIITGFFVPVALETLAGEGYARHLLPGVGWWGAVVLGLIVIPASVACLPAGALVVGMRWRRHHRDIGRDILLDALDSLLRVHHDLTAPRAFRGMRQRLYECRLLELAAHRVERDLLPPSAISNLGSGNWLSRRAAGWAEAIRFMQRQVVAPVPGSQDKLERLLAHEIRCMATGDLGALAWREPPPSPSRRATVKRQAISVARAVTVAAIPFAAVLAAQPFLHASPAVFDWARITTGIWALLYVLLSIDPALHEKISTARDMASLFHAPAGSPGDGQQRRAGS